MIWPFVQHFVPISIIDNIEYDTMASNAKRWVTHDSSDIFFFNYSHPSCVAACHAQFFVPKNAFHRWRQHFQSNAFFLLLVSISHSVPTNGTRRSGNIWAIGSATWLAHSVDLRSIGIAAHRNAHRFRNATEEIFNKFASVAATHQQCIQRSNGVSELDEGGDYLRRRLWLVFIGS